MPAMISALLHTVALLASLPATTATASYQGASSPVLSAEEAKEDVLRYVNSLPTVSSFLTDRGSNSNSAHPTSTTSGVSATATNPLCDSGDFNCCYITNASTTNSCDIGTFPKDTTTLVHPGGDTRCIFSYSTPYSFQVIPGRTDRLMIYFQGGGACWDKQSSLAGFCTTDCVPNTYDGVFNRTNPYNAMRDYTAVVILYCSGDAHIGDVIRPYTDQPGNRGENVTQKGLLNVAAALDWIRQQQVYARLETTFDSLVITGCSAGAISAQHWSREIINRFPAAFTSIIADSYALVFPDDVISKLYKDINYCSAYFLSSTERALCNTGQLSIEYAVTETLAANPTVPFAFVQSKADWVQLAFYVIMGDYYSSSDVLTNKEEFYYLTNQLFQTYNVYAPFLVYYLDGVEHCFNSNATFYSRDPTDLLTPGAVQSPSMSVWTANVVGQNNGVLKADYYTNTTTVETIDGENVTTTSTSNSPTGMNGSATPAPLNFIRVYSCCFGDLENPINSTIYSGNDYTEYCDSDLYAKDVLVFDQDGDENGPQPSDDESGNDTTSSDESLSTGTITAIVVSIVVGVVVAIGLAVGYEVYKSRSANTTYLLKNTSLKSELISSEYGSNGRTSSVGTVSTWGNASTTSGNRQSFGVITPTVVYPGTVVSVTKTVGRDDEL